MDCRRFRLFHSLRLLLAAGGAGLLALGAATVLAQEGPSISIDPASGPCGTQVQVTGEGFEPDVGVFVFGLSASHIFGFELEEPSVTTDAGGRLSTTIPMPRFPSSCPSPAGMIVFVCPRPLCEPKIRVPFEESGRLSDVGFQVVECEAGPGLFVLDRLSTGAAEAAVEGAVPVREV